MLDWLLSALLGLLTILAGVIGLGLFKSPAWRANVVRRLDPKAYQMTPAPDLYRQAKASVYLTLSPMTRIASLTLLSEVARELIGGDPNISLERTQTAAPALAAIAAELTAPEFIFLCLAAADHTIATQLTERVDVL